MNVTGIMIFCERIKDMIAFYRDVVGLEPDEPQPFPPRKFFRFRSESGATLCLHSGTKPNGGRQKLMVHADDIDGLISRLKTLRRSFRPPKPNAKGKVMFDFFDPEGNRIQVSSTVKVGQAK